MPYMTNTGRQEGNPPPGWVQQHDGTWAAPGGVDMTSPGDGTGVGSTPNAQPQGGSNPDAGDAEAAARAADAAAQAKKLQDYNNHFNYGGYAGGAADNATWFQNEGINAQKRKGEQINTGLANADRNTSLGDRGQQQGMAGLLAGRANGSAPLISQMQADRQMGQAAAAQSSMAASARGPAGLALAQQGAAANTAAMQSNISNQAQINGSQEQLQNTNAALGAYSGIRGQDAQQQGQDFAQAQAQAAINAAQRQANDQYSQGNYANSIDVNKAQLGAQGNQASIESGQGIASANRDAQTNMHSQDRTDKYIGYGLGAAGTVAGIAGMAYFGGKPGQGGAGVAGGNPVDTGSGGTPGGSNPSNSPGDGYWTPDGRWISSDVTAKQNIQPLGGLSHNASLKHEAAMMAAIEQMKMQQDAQRYGLLAQGPAVGDSDITAKFASGLAPSSYDYRPGMPGATPGRKVGPMAQNMASNDITGTAVRQNPNTGLLAIDNSDGLKVALGGVGHLAQKQQITDAEVAKLKAMADGMQQNTAAQSQGLLAPTTPQQAPPMADPRLVEARRLLEGTQEQGTGLLAQGPSVGRTYLDYVRGQ